MPRILITGDRHWQCLYIAREVVRRLIKKYGRDFVVIHGDASGVDLSFDEACRRENIPTEPHPARWRELGRSAGPRRNSEMISTGIDFCISVHRSLSRSHGTQDCVSRCLEANIPVYLIDSNKVRPRQIWSVEESRLEPSPSLAHRNQDSGSRNDPETQG